MDRSNLIPSLMHSQVFPMIRDFSELKPTSFRGLPSLLISEEEILAVATPLQYVLKYCSKKRESGIMANERSMEEGTPAYPREEESGLSSDNDSALRNSVPVLQKMIAEILALLHNLCWLRRVRIGCNCNDLFYRPYIRGPLQSRRNHFFCHFPKISMEAGIDLQCITVVGINPSKQHGSHSSWWSARALCSNDSERLQSPVFGSGVHHLLLPHVCSLWCCN